MSAQHTPGKWSKAVDAAIQYAPKRLHADREAFGKVREIAAKADAECDGLLTALERAERKLSAYVGVCTGDKELTDAVLPMTRVAIAKVKGGAT
jgi:hypothetical protein